MGPRYSFESDSGEHVPLDNASSSFPQRRIVVNRPSHNTQPNQPSRPQYEDESSSAYRDYPQTTTTTTTAAAATTKTTNPPPLAASFSYSTYLGANPDSTFPRSRQEKTYGDNAQRASIPPFVSRPIPPIHRDTAERSWRPSQANSVTPGADNFSEAAAGGIPGLAMSVAERNARESGIEAIRGTQPYQQPQPQPQQPYPQVYQRPQAPQQPSYDDIQPYGHETPYDTPQGHYAPNNQSPYQHGHGSSLQVVPVPLGQTSKTQSFNSLQSDPFRDPHLAYGQRINPSLGQVNPNDIDDDGDDGLEYRRSARNSMLSLGNTSNRGGNGATAAAGAVGGATAGGVLGSLIGRNRKSAVNYDPVQNPAALPQGGDTTEYDVGTRVEKSDWITKQSSSRKKWTWIFGILVLLVIAGAVVGGVVGSMFANKGNKKSSGGKHALGQSAEQDAAENGDLTIDSDEIQSLLNNPRLHKVFPGVDYTPINVQYPACLENPPSQNNVTRDVAILSQLTNTIRLYGTDCNQTQMAIHALRQLKLQDEVKIWLGVWQDQNDTTNTRQLEQMWNVLDEYGDEPFKGLIVGNEILFRDQMTAQTVGELLDTVRQNLTKHGWDLPVATSDLGDNWDADLANISDYIMGNVHPFFAGITAEEAASWTWTFWNNKAGSFFKSDTERNVIAEIGWPTQGGTGCGAAASCTEGSVAGIDELNILLDTWVCQALENGTNYFWFEMFDEPWKIDFNDVGKEWEDHWGILDVNRNLKPGVKIPDCGGMTV